MGNWGREVWMGASIGKEGSPPRLDMTISVKPLGKGTLSFFLGWDRGNDWTQRGGRQEVALDCICISRSERIMGEHWPPLKFLIIFHRLITSLHSPPTGR